MISENGMKFKYPTLSKVIMNKNTPPNVRFLSNIWGALQFHFLFILQA